MFYVVSKILGWLLNPLHLGMVLLGAALVLRVAKRRPRARKWLVVVACAEMWLTSLRLVSEPLTWGLERRYWPNPPLDREPSFIVVLGGFTRVPERGDYELTEASDRLVETVRLAHLHPGATIVFSGAFADNYGADYAEARAIPKLMVDMGVAPARILVDDRSLNTRENALESKRIIDAASSASDRGPVLLVTSAMHMPRAVGCFEKVGLHVVPWPVDYRMKGLGLRGLFPGVDDMSQTNDALHEYFGLFAYRVSGYL